MAWIKCTDRMPPEMEPVISTAKDESGRKYVYSECRWEEKTKQWTWPISFRDNIWAEICETVTHWMPMPEPAED